MSFFKAVDAANEITFISILMQQKRQRRIPNEWVNKNKIIFILFYSRFQLDWRTITLFTFTNQILPQSL